MTSLVVSQNICFGVMLGMALRLLVSPEEGPGVAGALFFAALFGYLLFGHAVRREAENGDKR